MWRHKSNTKYWQTLHLFVFSSIYYKETKLENEKLPEAGQNEVMEWSALFSSAVRTHRTLTFRGRGGGEELWQISPPRNLHSLSFSQWLLISSSVCFCLIFIISLTIFSQLQTTLDWEKVLSAPPQVRLFLTLWYPNVTLLSWGVKGRRLKAVWRKKDEGTREGRGRCLASLLRMVHAIPSQQSDVLHLSGSPEEQNDTIYM